MPFVKKKDFYSKNAFSALQLLGLYTQDTSSDEATAASKEETAACSEMWYRNPEEHYENTLQESKMCEGKITESLRQEKISKIVRP